MSERANRRKALHHKMKSKHGWSLETAAKRAGASQPSRHVTMRSPFGNTRAETTGSSWVNLRNNLPVRVSHITAVPSWLQVSNRSPKGKKLKPMTKLLWPFNTRRAPSGPHNVGEVHSLHEATC